MNCAHCFVSIYGVSYSVNNDSRKWCSPECMKVDLPAPPPVPAASTPVHLPTRREPAPIPPPARPEAKAPEPPVKKPAAPHAPEKKKPSRKGR